MPFSISTHIYDSSYDDIIESSLDAISGGIVPDIRNVDVWHMLGSICIKHGDEILCDNEYWGSSYCINGVLDSQPVVQFFIEIFPVLVAMSSDETANTIQIELYPYDCGFALRRDANEIQICCFDRRDGLRLGREITGDFTSFVQEFGRTGAQVAAELESVLGKIPEFFEVVGGVVDRLRASADWCKNQR